MQSPDAKAARLGQIGRVQATAVVADFQRQHTATQRQVHHHTAGLRVFAHIGQGLLHGAIGHQRHARRQGQGVPRQALAGAQFAQDAGALFKPAAHPLQCGQQALLQDGRAQVLHDALAGFNGVRHGFQCGHGTLLHLRRAGMAANPVQLKLQRGERAAHVVVDLPRNGLTLGFDAGLQVLRQFGQAQP